MSCSLKASAASIQEVSDSLRFDDQSLQQLGAALEGSAEALLLVADPAGDRLALGDQLRVGLPHQLDRALGEAAQPGRLEPERVALLDRPAHDPAQDVAAVLVGGDDAVGDQEGGTARVVGDDPHRPGHRAALFVGAAGELLGEVDQRPHVVGLEDRGHVLEDRRHPVQPHAGVDVAHRQLGEAAVLGEVVAHEDVVPELEEAVGVVARALVGGAELRGRGRGRAPSTGRRARSARPARSCPRGRAGRSARRGRRSRSRVAIASSSGPSPSSSSPPKTVTQIRSGSIPKPCGRELPAPGDRLLLEVVAEAPVAEHLEEGEVAGGRCRPPRCRWCGSISARR